jgi:hypothetical protein
VARAATTASQQAAAQQVPVLNQAHQPPAALPSRLQLTKQENKHAAT